MQDYKSLFCTRIWLTFNDILSKGTFELWSPFSCVIFLLTQPQVANQQKKIIIIELNIMLNHHDVKLPFTNRVKNIFENIFG